MEWNDGWLSDGSRGLKALQAEAHGGGRIMLQTNSATAGRRPAFRRAFPQAGTAVGSRSRQDVAENHLVYQSGHAELVVLARYFSFDGIVFRTSGAAC